ncbi:DNA polymerase III subunit gamma/tau [Paenibacillus larvae]|uniref:DNA-directed DNA polymerase n=1 Tax=Paenibacillus larvae subsp. larvae DSM 25430 TaxID=697284 RepID=V9WCJ6_9BACL|nr:DNA polymerase III subunit gamma/tau [Paenibacillus larvae]AHD07579.1 DNA polymerase III subunit gamma/tau [Paenibacillus larvae subsp. larvae DSM 25430]AVG14139.1 DNA polymerase III subunit gamma/tau [Paenibacillus larvae subsp. larvae DSM 25430]MDR5567918.1 DNA polymerase III subunit gamma/tau [Paenibacillus larvae]MDR5594077.1 DNA polymerase III subunit gamma/tau [Paenibacillus larvae]
MAHIALYRTWRSQLFRDVVGQKHITQTLQNSLREQRFTHAYLFSGPRGTGKTSTAKIFAKAVNCMHGPAEEPCNECSACIRITQGAVMDVIEIDAASNRGVEEIRDIRDKVKYAPTEVRYKVYIIDEVHMLTTEAFNALLKTLEEPPEHVIFILATTEPHKLPATIISRCQRFDFRRISLEEQVQRLRFVCKQEGIHVEDEALHYIGRLSDGGMRDALSILDQASSYAAGSITVADVVAMTGGLALEQFERLARSVKEKDLGTSLEIIDSFMQEGKSADKCMESLILYFRDLLMVRLVPESAIVTDRIYNIEQMKQMAGHFSIRELTDTVEVLSRYQSEMKFSVQPQTILEIAVMKICHADCAEGASNLSSEAASPPQDLLKVPDNVMRRLQQLEQNLDRLMAAGAPSAETNVSARGGNIPRNAKPVVSKRKTTVKLDAFVPPPESIREVSGKWAQVLSLVKERKITVHAWLVDGEPVSLHDQTVLVAFKSAMHRDTTEKPANKQLIEQVMAEVLGKPYKLATVMQKEWKDAQATPQPTAPEVMELQHENDNLAEEKEWITEAIQLFGESLVTIKED